MGVQSGTGVIRNHYLSKEESFMYDRENRFRMEDTMNAARIEYTEKAVMHMAARRCDVIRISQTEAVLALLTKYNLPNQFYLDIPDARITKIGCVMLRVNANNTIHVRFLRMLTQKELDRIFVFSTHPAHKDRKLDIRSF
ncbi:hypothetical protein AGR1_10625 [Agrobacterium sp. B1(2019)]|nr:hypothetical protein AGR1_10625 [Agrobacterium sp. B1(2019)]